MMRRRLFFKTTILALLAMAVVTSGFRCKWITPSQKELTKPVELTWWGVLDEQESFNDIIASYQAAHPHVKISYRKLRMEEFESELVNALAEDRGPDIFTLHNTWVTKHLSKIEPLPATTKMAFTFTQTSLGFKQESITEIRTTPSITPAQVKNVFVDAVYDDAVRDGKVIGLPLSVDTLVLFYNRDLLNTAGIPLPPATWLNVQENVKRLTFQDKEGKIIQSGIALGADNVERGSDTLSLLMLQNGAVMTNGRVVTFAQVPSSFPDRTYNPGPEAARFYSDFANPGKEVYTWTPEMPNSVDAFAQGTVAMMIGYQYHIAQIDAKRQGKLNYGIAPVPQIEGRTPVNFASHWLLTISKKSKNVNEAWDFVQFATTKQAEAKKYTDKTKKPTALRGLIEEQKQDDTLAVFANQLLTAKTWYRGNDATVMESAFKEMVNTIRTTGDMKSAIERAVLKIQQTL